VTRIPNSEHHSSGDNFVSWKNSETEQNRVIEVSPQGNTKIKLEGNYYEPRSNLHGVEKFELAWRG